MTEAVLMKTPKSDLVTDAVKIPPHSLEAEQSVLGGLMLDENAWNKICDVVYPDDFYRPEHKQIFAAISGVCKLCQPIDAITVIDTFIRFTFTRSNNIKITLLCAC